jgi:site-specific DNA-methyltransferase (adenine-specific)
MQQLLFDITSSNEKLKRRNEKSSNHRDINKVKKVGPFELDRVYLAECIDAMKQLPYDSVDLAIADPPYNLSKGGKWKWDNSVRLTGFGGEWSKVMAEWDDMPMAEYFKFTLAWLAQIKRVVRLTGSLWIHGTYHNIGIINFALQLLDIEILNEIVWYKRNSFPNLSGRRMTASHETILWAHTGGAKNRKYYFAYDKSKAMPCPEDCLKEQGKQMRTVWDIPNNKNREEIRFGKHPTQKPVRLLTRMLELSAREGDILLVPFAGSGSDCIAAKNLGIRYLAFENNLKYVEICNKRLERIDSKEWPIVIGRRKENKKVPSQGKELNRSRPIKIIPSLIKWTGSKRSQASVISSLMPCYRRYFEPFLGGGALLYLAAVPGSMAGDLYKPLIQLWQLIQVEPEKVIEDYECKWTALKNELDSLDFSKKKIEGDRIPKYYYEVRNQFNKKKDPLELNFLMRTCVNGIVRFNDKGEFNNSFHLSRRGMEPRRFANVVKSWHSVIQGVHFVCQDYMSTLGMTEKDDFVYLDPPYAGNRQRYIRDLDLERFFASLEELNTRCVKWALSFDGQRGSKDLSHSVPSSLFKRHFLLPSGNSAINKVLNGPVEQVQESLYLNY